MDRWAQLTHLLSFACCSVSLPPLGAIAGSLLSTAVLARLGRRAALALSAACFLAGFLAMGVAALPRAASLVAAGRAATGLGVGLAVPSAALYISEVKQDLGATLCLVFRSVAPSCGVGRGR